MFRRIIHTFGIRAISAALNLLIAVLLSRYLGPEGKGNQSIILTTISLILIFSNLVGGATLVYLVPRFGAHLLLIPSYAWSLIMGIISFPVLYFVPQVTPALIPHICLLAILFSVLNIHTNVMIGRQQIALSNYLVLLQSLLLVAWIAIEFTLIRNLTVGAYVRALYLSFSASSLISIYHVRKSFSNVHFLPIRQYFPAVSAMYRLGLQNQVAHITQLLSFRLSYFILGEYKGMAAVGVFGNGISLAESIWLISKSMALVQYSWVSNSSDNDSSARLTMQMVKGSLIISSLFILPLLLLPSSVYVFVFGKGFEQVNPVIWTLAPGVLFYNISILIGHYYSGSGKYYMNSAISGAGLLVSIALYFLLIPKYSTLGAGLATSASYIFTSIVFLCFFASTNPGWWKYLRISREDLRSLYGKPDLKSRK